MQVCSGTTSPVMIQGRDRNIRRRIFMERHGETGVCKAACQAQPFCPERIVMIFSALMQDQQHPEVSNGRGAKPA